MMLALDYAGTLSIQGAFAFRKTADCRQKMRSDLGAPRFKLGDRCNFGLVTQLLRQRGLRLAPQPMGHLVSDIIIAVDMG
jgi:hypothetical protein